MKPETPAMKTREIATCRKFRFDIVESPNVLHPGNSTLRDAIGQVPEETKALVVIDAGVDRCYGEEIDAYLQSCHGGTRRLVLPGGEANKSMPQVMSVISALNAANTLRRKTPVVAIGGGVVLDVVGLAAGLFRRGVPYIRVPTTLLSQVDVSVAAKTGINFEGFRNRIGSYNPPRRSILDRSFLTTVSEREMRSGMGEILKLSLIRDPRLFDLLAEHGDDLLACRLQHGRHAGEVLSRAVQGMIDELGPDLWEDNLARPTDYGHTFSPLIEMRALPRHLHGEAVALDCVFSAILAQQRGLLDPAVLNRIVAVTRSLGLLTPHEMFADPQMLWNALADVTRHRNGQQHVPLLTRIGAVCFVNDLTHSELATAARSWVATTRVTRILAPTVAGRP